MSKSRVVLSQELVPSLEVKPAPYPVSKRWCSNFEREHGAVWPTIFMTQRAYEQVNDHAARTLDLEVGGMLVGQACLSPDLKPYIVIEAYLEAFHVDQGAAHLTFTSNTLSNLLNRLEDQYPDKQIVGWYHTHPALSVFLSSMDVWLHTHFFPEAWHVALVIDPYVNQGGFFCYADGGSRYLHPKNYVGFYEVLASGSKSVATWYNLESCEEAKTPTIRANDEVVKDEQL